MTNMTHSYAGLWVRVWAFAFDYIAIALYLVVVTVLSLALGAVFPDIPRVLFGNPLSGQISGFFAITLPVTLYFGLLEASPWQASWGKRRKGLQVVRTDGGRLSGARSLGRTALKFIPWELAHTCIWQVSFAPQEPSMLITAGFVLVWVLVGANVVSLLVSKRHQTLYDRLADTCVVRV
jgi:uncharacterized RDD family membrane protein YckC